MSFLFNSVLYFPHNYQLVKEDMLYVYNRKAPSLFEAIPASKQSHLALYDHLYEVLKYYSPGNVNPVSLVL